MMIIKRFLSSLILIFLTSTICFCQKDSIKTKNRTLPFAKNWFEDKNINLPLPFGVSAFFTYMSRGVDITNVDVAFGDQSKQSIDDFTDFELQNKSTVSAIKLDAWILPFLNVYGLLGYVSTNASLDATITIDKIVFPGPPIIIPISNQSTIRGSYYGIGTSMVAGHENWFILGDANYGYSKLDDFDGKIDFWMFSARSGFQSLLGQKSMRTWIGGMYLSSNRTLQLNVENDNLGVVEVDVYQQTINPWTLQVGTSISPGKHFEIMGEIGTNFGDASIGVLSGTYRF